MKRMANGEANGKRSMPRSKDKRRYDEAHGEYATRACKVDVHVFMPQQTFANYVPESQSVSDRHP